MRRLKTYGWPGNIRELRNAVERAMLLVEDNELTADQFPVASSGAVRLTEAVDLPPAGIDLEQLEQSLVVQALERSHPASGPGSLMGVGRISPTCDRGGGDRSRRPDVDRGVGRVWFCVLLHGPDIVLLRMLPLAACD
jgi:hypothetical protein